MERALKRALYVAIDMAEPAATLVDICIDLENRPLGWSLDKVKIHEMLPIKFLSLLQSLVAATVPKHL